MGMLAHLFYPWGMVLQLLALLHFAKRRPNFYWIWIILMAGAIGAAAYLIVEAAPDFPLLAKGFQIFPRRKRIKSLEIQILDNPSQGNLEELADLYFDDGKFDKAKATYDRALQAKNDSPNVHYRRALSLIQLGHPNAAIPDLENVVLKDPSYDFRRAIGVLANCYAKTGENERAEALFQEAVRVSTISETYVNYADFLASQGRPDAAREMATRILNKRATMPSYQRRNERVWIRKAKALMKDAQVKAVAASD